MTEKLLDDLYVAYDFLSINQKYDDLIKQIEDKNEAYRGEYAMLKSRKASFSFIHFVLLYLALCSFGIGVLFERTSQIAGLIAIGLGVYIVYRTIKSKKNKQAQLDKEADSYWETVLKPQIEENEKTIAKARKESQAFQGKNKNVVIFLPEDYRDDIEAVSYIIHVLRNNMADTLKEALQLYSEEQHRRAMEEAVHGFTKTMEAHNQKMQSYMTEISEQQREISKQQRETNSHLADIELLTYLDYSKK